MLNNKAESIPIDAQGQDEFLEGMVWRKLASISVDAQSVAPSVHGFDSRARDGREVLKSKSYFNFKLTVCGAPAFTLTFCGPLVWSVVLASMS